MVMLSIDLSEQCGSVVLCQCKCESHYFDKTEYCVVVHLTTVTENYSYAKL